MSAHTAEHEAILQAVACGDLERDAGEVQGLLESCETCRTLLEDLTELAHFLDRDALGEREALESRAHETDATVARELLHALRDDERPRTAGAAAPTTRRLRWVAAVAAAVVVALVWVRGRPDGDQSPVLLGGTMEIVAPAAGASTLDVVRWRHDARPGGWYELRIYDADDVALVEVLDLEGTEWTPTDEARARLRGATKLRIEVRAFAPSNGAEEQESAECDFTPSSP